MEITLWKCFGPEENKTTGSVATRGDFLHFKEDCFKVKKVTECLYAGRDNLTE